MRLRRVATTNVAAKARSRIPTLSPASSFSATCCPSFAFCWATARFFPKSSNRSANLLVTHLGQNPDWAARAGKNPSFFGNLFLFNKRTINRRSVYMISSLMLGLVVCYTPFHVSASNRAFFSLFRFITWCASGTCDSRAATANVSKPPSTRSFGFCRRSTRFSTLFSHQSSKRVLRLVNSGGLSDK